MRALWIETLSYVGLCRRERGELRIFERRRKAGGGPAPSLKTLIRQLRITDLSRANEEALASFRLRLAAAADLARDLGEADCRDELAGLLSAIDQARDVRALSQQAADSLVRAAQHLP